MQNTKLMRSDVTRPRPHVPNLVVLSSDRILVDALSAVLGSCQCTALPATTDPEIVARIAAERDAVALVDLERPLTELTPDALVGSLTRENARVIVVAAPDARRTRHLCAEAGAAAFVSRADGLDDVIECLTLVARGDEPSPEAFVSGGFSVTRGRITELASLTRQEARVLDALVRGVVAKQIARELVVSLPTVRSHIRSILVKLHARSQVHAVAIAHDAGWRFDGPGQF